MIDIMNILRNIFAASLLCILLTSCFSDFDPKIDSKPVLCMNAQLNTTDPLTVRLTRTWNWNEGDPVGDRDIDITVRDASVGLWVNGRFVCELEQTMQGNHYNENSPFYEEQLVYIAKEYIPAPGDVVKLIAESPVYGVAEAETTIPSPVEIDRVETKVSDVHKDQSYWSDGVMYSGKIDLDIYFTDPAPSDDFYKLVVSSANGFYDSWEEPKGYYSYISSWSIDYTKEPLFSEHVSSLESIFSDTYGYSIFSDRQISGKTYPLHVEIDLFQFFYCNPDNLPEVDKVAIQISLQHLTREYYNHVLSIWEANDGLVGSLGSIGLGESVPAYSNVSTRAGIVSAEAPAYVEIPLRQLLESALSE